MAPTNKNSKQEGHSKSTSASNQGKDSQKSKQGQGKSSTARNQDKKSDHSEKSAHGDDNEGE